MPGGKQAVSAPWGAMGKGSERGDPLNLLFPSGSHTAAPVCRDAGGGREAGMWHSPSLGVSFSPVPSSSPWVLLSQGLHQASC